MGVRFSRLGRGCVVAQIRVTVIPFEFELISFLSGLCYLIPKAVCTLFFYVEIGLHVGQVLHDTES